MSNCDFQRDYYYYYYDDDDDDYYVFEVNVNLFPSQIVRIALLQVATADHVYLLDAVRLADVLDDSGWQRLASALFCDEKNLTLGLCFWWFCFAGWSCHVIVVCFVWMCPVLCS